MCEGIRHVLIMGLRASSRVRGETAFEVRFARSEGRAAAGHPIVAAGVLLIALAGCAADHEGGETAIRDSRSSLSATPDLRIDGYEYNLAPVNWMGVSPTGTIVVMQPMDGAIRFFDERGALLGELGRKGGGPGEFERMVRGGWQGDSLWVSDTQLHRLTMISPADLAFRVASSPTRLRNSVNDEGAFVGAAPVPYAVYADDTLLMAGSSGDEYRLFRVTPDGQVLSPPMRIPTSNHGFSYSVGTATVYRHIPFAPRVFWGVSPNGDRIATVVQDSSRNDRIIVTAIDSSGREVFVRAIDLTGRPIPENVRDSALDALAARPPPPPAHVRTTVRKRTPHTYPLVSAIVVGSDRRTWIALGGIGKVREWLVLDANGGTLRPVSLPVRAVIHVAGPHAVWTTEKDELGVQSIVRYTLQPAADMNVSDTSSRN